MKRYLIYLIIFFSAIISINNIEAQTNTKLILDYDSDYLKNTILKTEVKNYIDNTLIPYINNSSRKNEFEYFIFLNSSLPNELNNISESQSQFFLTIFFAKKTNSIFNITNYFRNRYTDFLEIEKIPLSNINTDDKTFSSSYTYSYNNVWISYDEILNNDISSTKLNDFLTNVEYLSTKNSGERYCHINDNDNIENRNYKLYDAQEDNALLLYYSSTDISTYKYTGWNNYAKDIEVNYNDKTYYFEIGTDFPTYKYMEYNYGGDYSLNQTINCENIDRIEINIDIPVRQIFNWNFTYDIYYSEIENQVVFPTYKYYSSHEYIDIELPLRYEKIDTLSEDINHNEVYTMNGSISMEIGSPETYPPGYDYLKIIIDTSDYNSDLTLDFKCNYNMHLNTITNQVAESEKNYITVDMTNKYGIYLIPKAEGYQREKIYLNGNYRAFIYDSYDARETMSDENRKLLETIDDTDNPFIYYFDYYKRYMILFTNKNYTDNNYQTTVIFDADIFNYVIKEKPFDTPIITDPNTNEEIKIYDDDSYVTESKSDIINMLSKSFESNNLKQLIANIYNEFKKSGIGFYIFIIISSSIILLIIKAIRK